MIGPNMATMLGLVLTDAPLEVEIAQAVLREAADTTFNCISVDGHMSTNDTVLLLANGAAGGPPLVGRRTERVPQGDRRSVPPIWPGQSRPTAKGPRI